MSSYSNTDTIVVWTANLEVISLLKQLQKELGFKIYTTTNLSDLFAMPCFLWVIDSKMLHDFISLFKKDLQDFFESSDERILLCDTSKYAFPQYLKSKLIRIESPIFSKKILSPIIIESRNNVLREQLFLNTNYKSKVFRILFFYKMTIERTPIHLMDISYSFNLSERTINRDLEDLHKIFPSMQISIVKDGYGQERRSASASRSLKTNQRHESLKFQELSTRIKIIIEMADILASSNNVEVADTCSKYKLSERTLRRYMKLIKDVYLNMNVKFSKDKGYYSYK